jgi:carbon monoxide dehydrogenase subunit G
LAHFSILSATHTTQSTSESLFDFMGDFNNFKHLLPEDKIQNFECTAEQCSFGIKGLMPLTIKIKERVPASRITFETTGIAKFVFTLHIHLLNEQKTNVELEGDMNPFIKAMAEKPLSDLVNTMATRLAALKI